MVIDVVVTAGVRKARLRLTADSSQIGTEFSEKNEDSPQSAQRKEGRQEGEHLGRAEAGKTPKWNDWSYQRRGVPPCFCVCRGNKGLTGEWLASRGNKGVTGRESEEKTKGEGMERSEMVQEPRPLSITGEA
jgi:hypothetical protein